MEENFGSKNFGVTAELVKKLYLTAGLSKKTLRVGRKT